MNLRTFILSCIICLSLNPHSVSATVGSGSLLAEKVLVNYRDTSRIRFVNQAELAQAGWDTLAQPRFWQEVLNLSPDSMLINVAATRRILLRVSATAWKRQTEEEKAAYKDSINRAYNLDQGTQLNVTSGKKEFYEIKKTLGTISTAVQVFENEGTDPWFAQTIILIESPGKFKAKSSVGAYGPFQLMPAVARKYGLIVNTKVDQREDLGLSARASARFVGGVCVPSVRRMLNERNIAFKESDLWFRLLVLHAYHAGAGNVAAVLNAINPQEGGMDLIRTIWVTQAGTFKNESQNYSQIALASLINYDRLINAENDTVFLNQGDRMYLRYKRNQQFPFDPAGYLNVCIRNYETDLIDGIIPADHFVRQINAIQKEINIIASREMNSPRNSMALLFPDGEEHLNRLGTQLMSKRRYEDAIRVLQINIEKYPTSYTACDTLGRAYKLAGNIAMASKYSERSQTLKSIPLQP